MPTGVMRGTWELEVHYMAKFFFTFYVPPHLFSREVLFKLLNAHKSRFYLPEEVEESCLLCTVYMSMVCTAPTSTLCFDCMPMGDQGGVGVW
jgi:hypothetical protein